MWQFLGKVYEGDNGGCGLLIVFIALLLVIETIILAAIKRRKSTLPKE